MTASTAVRSAAAIDNQLLTTSFALAPQV